MALHPESMTLKKFQETLFHSHKIPLEVWWTKSLRIVGSTLTQYC